MHGGDEEQEEGDEEDDVVEENGDEANSKSNLAVLRLRLALRFWCWGCGFTVLRFRFRVQGFCVRSFGACTTSCDFVEVVWNLHYRCTCSQLDVLFPQAPHPKTLLQLPPTSHPCVSFA